MSPWLPHPRQKQRHHDRPDDPAPRHHHHRLAQKLTSDASSTSTFSSYLSAVFKRILSRSPISSLTSIMLVSTALRTRVRAGGRRIDSPSRIASGTFLRAFSKTTLPTVSRGDGQCVEMGTPAASVPRVMAKARSRRLPILPNTGSRSLSESTNQAARYCSFRSF